MQHWVPSTHFRTETRFSKSPSLRTEPSLNKSRPAVISQNSAQQPDNCNMVTWSVLKENNTHIAKRALEASTDARSPECTEEPAHFCTIEMHSSHTVSLHCYAEHALHCRDCDPMISIIANYTLTLETFIFRVQSQVIVRMKVCKTNPSAPA